MRHQNGKTHFKVLVRVVQVTFKQYRLLVLSLVTSQKFKVRTPLLKTSCTPATVLGETELKLI